MKIVKWLATAMISLNSMQLSAGELHLEYADFYSHLRKLNSDELNALHFAFGFIHVESKELCQVSSVLVDTDKKDIEIPVQKNHRFVLPNEKALKMAKARLLVKLVEPQNQCDLSVLLEVKPELFSQSTTASEMLQYLDAFDAFFDKMGGFLSFMMPSPTGLQITFSDTAPEAFRNLASKEAQSWHILQDNLTKLPSDLQLTGIKQITALMPKS